MESVEPVPHVRFSVPAWYNRADETGTSKSERRRYRDAAEKTPRGRVRSFDLPYLYGQPGGCVVDGVGGAQATARPA